MPKQNYIKGTDIRPTGQYWDTGTTETLYGVIDNKVGKYVDQNALQSGAGSRNTIESDLAVVNGENNNIGYDCKSIMVSGNRNDIGGACKNVSVFGDGNKIDGGLENIVVYDSNRHITRSNISIVGDIRISDGTLHQFEFIDGGLDSVENYPLEEIYTTIDGGEDIVFKRFADNQYDEIDGGDNELS